MSENGNGNTHTEDDSVTVSEAAERLGVTLPRLQRALKRPEFAAHVRTGARPTRTGTRTVTLVSVSVLDDLSRWLGEQKQKHSRPLVLPSEGGQGSGMTPAQMGAFYDRLMAEKDARIEEQAGRIRDLQAALEHERDGAKRLADALHREQSLRLLSVEKVEPEADSVTTDYAPGEAVGSPEMDAPQAKAGESQAGGAEKDAERRVSWWGRLWGRHGQ